MVLLRHLVLGFGVALLPACTGDATDVASDPGSSVNRAGAANEVAGAANDDDDDAKPISGGCLPGDQDGVVGGNTTVKLYVTDTGFNVGTKDSGQPNIAVQNSTRVTLVLTNAGSKPHGFTVGCRPTGLPAECNQPTSCFPTDANVPALDPGDSVTVEFQTPLVEGEYEFTSDEPGDDGLIGEFVLL